MNTIDNSNTLSVIAAISIALNKEPTTYQGEALSWSFNADTVMIFYDTEKGMIDFFDDSGFISMQTYYTIKGIAAHYELVFESN